MEFEEKPIGGTKFVLDEYPPGKYLIIHEALTIIDKIYNK